MEEDGINAREFVTSPKYLASIQFLAGNLRQEGYQIGYDPVPKGDPIDSENPYHGLLWGSPNDRAIKRLIAGASWFVAFADEVSLT
jgi:hypothetical protein